MEGSFWLVYGIPFGAGAPPAEQSLICVDCIGCRPVLGINDTKAGFSLRGSNQLAPRSRDKIFLCHPQRFLP